MKNVNNNYKSLILIMLTALAGSGTPVFSKIGLEVIPPLPFTLIRFILATIILLPVLLMLKEKISFKDFKNAIPVSILGVLNVTLFAIGIRWTTASSGQMLYTVGPMLAALLSYLLIKETITINKISGVLIGFIGALLIILLPVINGESTLNGSLIGNLFVFLAVCSFAFYSVLSKKQQRSSSPLALTLYFSITTVIILSLIVPFDLASNHGWLNNISLQAIMGILYVGIFGTVFFYLIYQFAIKQASPVIASTVSYLQPVFTIIWAIFLLNEKLTPIFIFGTILTFTGVYLVTLRQKKINNEQ